MNNPESYVRYHRLQYRDNMRFLTENIGRIKFRRTNGMRIDVNDASNTMELCDGQDASDVCNGPGKLDVFKTHEAIRVLDVGSGDGRFTSDELRRALPAHCQLIGCDKSPAMVDYANSHHAGDGVKFELVEIGKHLPDHYIGAFDHIFSLFCYHWIPNQK